LPDIICQDERLTKIYGDQAYNGIFAKEIKKFGSNLRKHPNQNQSRGFVPVAKRWVVERTIAWSNFFRRIVKDYEYTISSSQQDGCIWQIFKSCYSELHPVNQT
jgi:transposase